MIMLWLSLASTSRAVLVGVTDSYEGYASPAFGTLDDRGRTRYDRLIDIIAAWNAVNVDFGVLLGDSLANDEVGWPLLQAAIENSEVPIHLTLGNHDWVNQTQSDGSPHPDSCFNLKPQEQVQGCPNTLYLLDHLQNKFGLTRPWYAWTQEGVLFVVLADELFDTRGYLSAGVSDIHDEQFYWFRDLVDGTSAPIIVFAHHPVFDTVAGTTSPTSPLNRLGWRPRVGEDEGDTVSVMQGSSLVIRAGGSFDPRVVTVGSEFQVQGDTDWYRIVSIAGNVLTLETPYQGATGPAALFGAGGHFNELTSIMKDPGNNIQVFMNGHMGQDFQFTFSGSSQLEVISDKIFAYSGNVAPADIQDRPSCNFVAGSNIVSFTHTTESYKIIPGTQMRTPNGDYLEVVDVDWSPSLGGPGSATLASAPDIATNFFGISCYTRATDPFTETRIITVDATKPSETTVSDFNYTTGWRSGWMLQGDFDDPGFPYPILRNASFQLSDSTARLTATAAYGVALYGIEIQLDYTIEAELKRVSGGGGGIVFRAQSYDSFYFFELDEATQSFKLGRSDGGVLTTLAEVQPTLPLNDEYKLTVTVRDSLVRTFVDDTPAIMFNATAYPQGRYGLFSRSTAGSDFEGAQAFGDIVPMPVPEPGLTPMLLAGAVLLRRMDERRRRINLAPTDLG